MNFNVTVELLAPLLYVEVLAPLLHVWEFQRFSLDAKIVRLIVVQLAEYHLRLSHLGV